MGETPLIFLFKTCVEVRNEFGETDDEARKVSDGK